MKRIVSSEPFTPEQLQVHRVRDTLRRDGGTPAGALEGLAAIVKEDTWRHVPDRDGHRFADFTAFVSAPPPFGLGYPVDQLRKLLALRHPHEADVPRVAQQMDGMRKEVVRLLRGDLPSAGPSIQPGPGRGKTRSATTGFTRDAEYVLSRLKRDDPAMADQVVRGEMTANAAARQKGWRYPRILVTSPPAVAASLAKHLDSASFRALTLLLVQECERREQNNDGG